MVPTDLSHSTVLKHAKVTKASSTLELPKVAVSAILANVIPRRGTPIRVNIRFV